VRERAAELASAAGITIEHIANSHVRKEDVVAEVLAVRGDHPGLVYIISPIEACDSYKPWHDKRTHRTFLRPDSGKCLHYYFYFIDTELGLIYVRVPTWCPFRLQFYCNANSASSNASPAPIATLLPAPAAPPLQLAAASLNTPSFPLLPHKICSQLANTWLVSD
jgi:hypothetical protein